MWRPPLAPRSLTAAGRNDAVNYKTDPDCLFCKIVAGEIPCFKVYEDDRVLAFCDINPIAPGHSLIIPKNHNENLMAMDPEDLTAVHLASRKLAPAIIKATGAEGITVMQLNGKAASQVVMHYHLHLMPRKQGDGIKVSNWELKPGDMDKIGELAAKIGQAI